MFTKTTSIFLEMEDDLNLSEMKDDLNLVNFRHFVFKWNMAIIIL